MIHVDVSYQVPLGSISKRLFDFCIRYTLKAEGKTTAVVGVAVVSDSTIQKLNRKYLRHHHATDILTFPYEEDALEADLIISADTARGNAMSYNVPVRVELARLAIHGTLHICGYDDTTVELRKQMKLKEDRYLTESLHAYRKRH